MVNRKGTGPERVKRVEGFTLIEAMISIGVISLVIPVIFSLLFISLRSELKIKALKTVKNNGDFALTYISDSIRLNAFKPIDCVGPLTEVSADITDASFACFKTKNNQCFEILVEAKALKLKNVNIVGCDPFLASASEVVLTEVRDVTVHKLNGTLDSVSIDIDVPDSIQANARFNTSSVTISFKVASTKDPTTSLDYYSKAKIRDY